MDVHATERDLMLELGTGYRFPESVEIMKRMCIEKMVYFSFVDVCVNFDMLMLNHKLLMCTGDRSMDAVVAMYDIGEIFKVWPPTSSSETHLSLMSFPLYFISHDLHVARGQMRVSQLVCPTCITSSEKMHESFLSKEPLLACFDVIYDALALAKTASQGDGRWAEIRPPLECVPTVWSLCLGNELARDSVQKTLVLYDDIVLDLLPFMCVARRYRQASRFMTVANMALTVIQLLQRYPHGYEKSMSTWFYGFLNLLGHDACFSDLHNALFVSSTCVQKSNAMNTLALVYEEWVMSSEYEEYFPEPVMTHRAVDDVLMMSLSEMGIKCAIFANTSVMLNNVTVFMYDMRDVLACDLVLTWHRIVGGPCEPLAFQLNGFTTWILTESQLNSLRVECAVRVCRFKKPVGFTPLCSDLFCSMYLHEIARTAHGG